jgi:hypothetical protein
MSWQDEAARASTLELALDRIAVYWYVKAFIGCR